MPRTLQPTTALYVRLPPEAAAKLQRAADMLEVPKKDVVAGLVLRHLHPDDLEGLSGITEASGAERSAIGKAAFYEYREPEVMTLEEAATFLRVSVGELEALAESGNVPARRIGEAWRLSRTALVDWLAASHAHTGT